MDKIELASQAEKVDQVQNKQIISIYKQKLSEQIKEKILSVKGTKDAHVNISIDENKNSNTFGSILKIDAVVSNDKQEKQGSIKKVYISVEKQNNKEQKDNSGEIKEVLSKTYGLTNEKINVKIQRKENG
jgi:2C-methyl-D-erythritol 2,4-cyclodiphosphate synthase